VQTAILNIGQLVTMAGSPGPRIGPEMGDLGIVSGAGVHIVDGRIRAVATSDEIKRSVSGECEFIDAGGRLVTPGFIDSHTHLIFGGDRINEFEMRARGSSYQEIKEMGGGIMSTVRATRSCSEDDLVRTGNERLQWLLAAGTTTVEVKSGYGLNPEAELKILRAAGKLGPQRIVKTFLGAHAIPPDRSHGEYLKEVLAILPEAERLADFCDIFVESGYFGDDDAIRLFNATSLKRRLHVDQFGNNGGAALAASLGAKTADHLEYTGPEGIEALRAAEVIPVLLPMSVCCLGLQRYPNARAMIEAGLPVVIASDFNPGSSPSPSLPIAMSLACTQMKMTPAESLTACTINAAHALGINDTTGSLEVGKTADVVIHDASDFREIPYWMGRNTATQLLIAGRRVFPS
jgi:imidazolonepropionase